MVVRERGKWQREAVSCEMGERVSGWVWSAKRAKVTRKWMSWMSCLQERRVGKWGEDDEIARKWHGAHLLTTRPPLHF